MAVLFTAAVLLSATALAQSTEQVVWSAVSYIYHGEKTPSLFSGPYDLTPVGANQLYEAGQVVRSRYLTSSSSNLTSSANIHGINQDGIDNSQLLILSTDDPWVSASAMAFMQALYPPRSGIVIDPESELGNSSLAQYPLNGYQYANVQTLSVLDFNRLWIAGDDGCNNWDIVNTEALSSPAYTNELESTQAFYQSLGSSVFWDFDPLDLNYYNAWDLWEYAAFEYAHNDTLVNSQTFTTDDLDQLFNLASSQQWLFNTPDSTGTLRAMAGRTYASYVLQQFSHQIGSNGTAEKLTLLFGDFEPMLAFFALSDLATGPSSSSFMSLPLYGSTMTFELFSVVDTPADANAAIPFPEDMSTLQVRFLFRNGTGESDQFVEYALFGNGNSADEMNWNDFVQDMGQFSLNDLVDWCTACDSGNLFCEALDPPVTNGTTGTSPSTSRNGPSAPVAGVIGAAVTIGVGLIIAAILAFVGFRLNYHPRERGGASDLGVMKRSGSGSGGGGFKGAEKLASDTDLAIKGGAGATIIRHERVGSWELNESPDQKHSSLDKDIETARSMSKGSWGRKSEDGLGGVDPYGEPVKALDQV